ncbi:MAG: PatB family C-S lyase [Bacteroidales bacterium]|nr:PatB family C-S lyase [Bacteroidales bacterium]
MDYNFDEIIDRKNTSSVKYDMRNEIFKNRDVIPMWLADMDFRTPDFIMDALRRRLDHEILGYSYIPDTCNEAVAGWLLRRHGWKIQPSWIGFSPGVVPALNLLVLAFTNPGDKIIVQPPVYFPFFSSIRNHGRIQVNNPLIYEDHSYSMDLSGLKSKIDDRTKMLFLCSPHNPTGNVWPRDVLEKLADICLKNNIIIVSDEIHADLVYEPFKHIPTASISDEIANNTITCMSPSKTFNLAGLSVSYLVIPNPGLRRRYLEILDHIHVGAGNIFGFVAMEAAYKSGDLWVNRLLHYLKGNIMLINDFIHKHIPEIHVIHTQATYLVWLDCHGLGLDHKGLNEFMIRKAGLGLSDGLLFGEEGRGFQRINTGCSRYILNEAMLKLERAAAKFINNNRTFL